MNEVAVIGVGMTRFGKDPNSTVRAMSEAAVRDALADAAVEPENVQAAFFSNAIAGLITGQEMIRGQAALRNTGVLGVPMFNVENACASGSSAFHLACMAVSSGMYDVVLAVGAEKMTHEDKTRSFGAIGTAMDLEQLAEQQVASHQGRSPFMDLYAQRALDYMERTGATVSTFADVAVKNHAHGVHNPHAQYRLRVTREEVLSSREIVPPLRLLMCSPIGDGAAAAVVCSRRFIERRRSEKPVWVRASVVLSGRDRQPEEPTVIERAAAAAYEIAGLGPEDLDVAELHDAAAPAELITYEDLRLCEAGEGPRLLASGHTALGGRLPVNPSGGLLSKGHPIGATGLAQIAELVWQLRGEADRRQVDGALVALAQNTGGFLGSDSAVTSIHILAA
jgi:acetyl-CoA acyltransferase